MGERRRIVGAGQAPRAEALAEIVQMTQPGYRLIDAFEAIAAGYAPQLSVADAARQRRFGAEGADAAPGGIALDKPCERTQRIGHAAAHDHRPAQIGPGTGKNRQLLVPEVQRADRLADANGGAVSEQQVVARLPLSDANDASRIVGE